MNNPIINPWMIYLVDVISGLDILASVLSVLALVATLFGIVFFIAWRSVEYEEGYEDDEKKNKCYLSLIKNGIIFTIAVFVACTFIPTKETAYTMLVSSYVTEENIETATDAIKIGVDYIFEKLDGGVSDD